LRKLEARDERWGKRQQCLSLIPPLTSNLQLPQVQAASAAAWVKQLL
jgi:hypothetical protein